MSKLTQLADLAISESKYLDTFFSAITPFVRHASSNLTILRYVDDLVQNSLMTLWRRLSDFDSTKGEITTFVYYIVRGEATKIRRKENKYVQFSENAEYDVPIENDTSMSKMAFALDRISQEDRDILKASYEDKKTLESIGLEMNMTKMGACKRRQKALDALLYEMNQM